MRAALAERRVHYPRAGQVLQILNRLPDYPRITRMATSPSTAIAAGHTVIMEKFRREHPPVFDGEAGVERTVALALQLAGKPGERRVGAPQDPRTAVG